MDDQSILSQGVGAWHDRLVPVVFGIGHGADRAAAVLSQDYRRGTHLYTVDPVNLNGTGAAMAGGGDLALDPFVRTQPDFAATRDNTSAWDNYTATDRSLSIGNVLAGFGRPYDPPPSAYATPHDVNAIHEDIARRVVPKILDQYKAPRYR